MKSLFQIFDEFMIRHQRKMVLVERWGEVIMHRYTLLRHEKLGDAITAESSRLPNLYLHHFIKEDSPDGPSQHSHAGNTLSIVLRGGYIERYRGKLLNRRPGTINIVRWPELHKIVSAQKNTWTLFYRGFRKSKDARVVPEPCMETLGTLCEKCKPDGVCFNVGKEYIFNTYSAQFNNGASSRSKFTAWFYAGPECDALIERRQRAMQRLGKMAPVTAAEQLEAGRKTTRLHEKDSIHA